MVASSRIAIFGGSFNPPHVGHVEICRYLLKQGLTDEILVVPCWQHPFDKDLAPYDDRVAMCRLAFGAIKGVEICEIERELGDVSHTVRTVDALAGKFPGAQLYLVVGSDLSREMESWRDIDELRRKVIVLTVPRGPGGPIPDVHATEIRKRALSGYPIADDLAPAGVANYIAFHKLYGPSPL